MTAPKLKSTIPVELTIEDVYFLHDLLAQVGCSRLYVHELSESLQIPLDDFNEQRMNLEIRFGSIANSISPA